MTTAKATRNLFCSLGFGMLVAWSPVYAALPPAPLNTESAAKVSALWTPDVERRMMSELQATGYGNPAAARVIGRYLKEGFEKAGYSLDETIYQFFTDPNAHPVEKNLLAKETGFRNIIAQISSNAPGFTEAYLETGAVSRRTVEEIRRQNLPPSTDGRVLVVPLYRDWMLPSAPTERSKIRMELSFKDGYDSLQDYVLAWNGSITYVLGKRDEFDDATLAVLDAAKRESARVLVEANVTRHSIEGGNSIWFADRSQMFTVTLPKPLSHYEPQ